VSIEAGKLRERITIQERNLVDNGRGGRKRPDGGPEWIDTAKGIRAEIIPLRGDEALSNSVVRSTQLYRVTIRARPDVTASSSLDWDGTKLNIKALAKSLDGREIVMTCESGKPA